MSFLKGHAGIVCLFVFGALLVEALWLASVFAATGAWFPPAIASLLVTSSAGVVLAYLIPNDDDANKNEKKTNRTKVFLGVVCGYLLVFGGVWGSIELLRSLQPQSVTGLDSEDYRVGPFDVVVLSSTSATVPLFEREVVELTINVTLDAHTLENRPFIGEVHFHVVEMDAPLVLVSSDAIVALSDADRQAFVTVGFDPLAGTSKETYRVSYEVVYNISVSPSNNSTFSSNWTHFEGRESGSLEFGITPRGVTSGWYLLFIFLGILTSFWWGVANDLLRGESALVNPKWTATQRLGFYLFLPFVSLLIALVIFRQFQDQLTVSTDPMINIVAGFTYGFLWQSVTDKFAGTLAAAKAR